MWQPSVFYPLPAGSRCGHGRGDRRDRGCAPSVGDDHAVLTVVGTEAQFNDGAGMGGDLRLPSVVALIARHGLFGGGIPDAGGFALHVFLADQRFLYLAGAVPVDLLLAFALPCAAAGAVLFRAFAGRAGFGGYGLGFARLAVGRFLACGFVTC